MSESWGCGLYTSAAYTRVFTVFYVLVRTASFASFASFSSYSSDLRIIGFIASKDLRETKAELGKNKALYIKENY